MGSTHLSLHYHLVFGTKNHEPFIHESWRPRLHSFIGGCIRTLDGIAENVDGISDHVHILAGLRATHTLSEFMREIKSRSSAWVNDNTDVRNFAWQEGYGAFTVSPSQRAKVRTYIQNQEEHHRTCTFREEYIALLKRSGVEFDERYL